MKIGFLVAKVSFGGGEKILNFLMREMTLKGHSVSVFSWNKEWENEELLLPYNIVPIPEIKVGILNKMKGIFSFKRELEKNRPDCLIIFSLSLAEFGLFSALLSGIPVILSERVDPKYLPQSKFHVYLKFLMYKLSSGVVFQTEKAKSFYSQIVQKKGTIIPNPVMCEAYQPSETCSKEIVAVGRLSEEKNYPMLLRAFSRLKNSEYILKIYGDGPLRNELSFLIDKLKINQRCFLMGHSNNISENIRQSDIFVMCSNQEGMPNALIEAMAMGLACISTDFNSGGARAIIENEKDGLLIPVNKEESLINALNLLISNNDLKQSLKEKAVLIRQKFNKDLIIDLWIEFILSKIRK